jgi:hypothetical protein
MNKAKMRNALERNKLEEDRMLILLRLLLLPPPQRRPPQQHVAAAALLQASHTTMMLDPIMRAASTSLGTQADMGVQQQSTSGLQAWVKQRIDACKQASFPTSCCYCEFQASKQIDLRRQPVFPSSAAAAASSSSSTSTSTSTSSSSSSVKNWGVTRASCC